MTETRPRPGFALPGGQPSTHGGRVLDFVALMKPRPMSVVVFTAIAGLLAAPVDMSPAIALIAIICIALGGGGAAALNMWFERDLDARMARTASRPLPAGRVTPEEALAFAVLLIVSSVVAMALVVGSMAAVMLALTILFYGVVYTMWLKRQTALNVVIGGGLASLLTPLTGWVSATGGLSWHALALFAFLVPWTPPHVWSQALVRAGDYASAGVPMMPVVAGSARTRWMIVGFTFAHAALALLPAAMGFTGQLWLAAALVGGAVLLFESVGLARVGDLAVEHHKAWRFYRLNSLYVMALLAALIVERAAGFMAPLLPVARFGG
ncbi:MAG: heme o synthase [Hyphomicrobiaceae bacterium]